MLQLRGKRLAAAMILLQLAVLCAFFAGLMLIFNLESVILAPWGCVLALAMAMLAADTAILYLMLHSSDDRREP